jgi:lipopolysaccharide biosynthesis glycosyltransferase
MINIFIGYDERMPLLHSVLSNSIIEHSSEPVAITPISLKNLKTLFKRDIDANQSTQFSFSRFLAPLLSNYEGWSIFMDNDIVCREDISKLWALRDEQYAVMCVKHDYEVKTDTKFLGEKQTVYAKKNWSSVMLFNNAKCKTLTEEYVNTASGLELHQFKWLESEGLIGELPAKWNCLAGYYPESEPASLIHYTDGGPYFSQYENSDFAKDWLEARERAFYIQKD